MSDPKPVEESEFTVQCFYHSFLAPKTASIVTAAKDEDEALKKAKDVLPGRDHYKVVRVVLQQARENIEKVKS